jgi:GNAT superfamily N-acetyltransferase
MPLDEIIPIQVIYTLKEQHITDLQVLYQETWWARQRTLPDIKRMLSQTQITVGLSHPPSDRLVGFCRLLSDGVYRAVLYDVVIADAYRHQGLGRHLIDAVLAHPDLQTIEAIHLFCLPELVPFYEKWGFTEPRNLPVKLMGRSLLFD